MKANLPTGFRLVQTTEAAALHVALGQRGWEPIVYASTVRAAYTVGVKALAHATGTVKQYRTPNGHTWAPTVRLYLPTWMVAVAAGVQATEFPSSSQEPTEGLQVQEFRALADDTGARDAVAALWRLTPDAKAVAAWLKARPRA